MKTNDDDKMMKMRKIGRTYNKHSLKSETKTRLYESKNIAVAFSLSLFFQLCKFFFKFFFKF